MTVPQEIQDLLARDDFDAVEEAWLGHLEEQPDDVDYFAAVARAVERAGDAERARLLLELCDEQLTADQRWADRLTLLRGAGALLLDPDALHPAILSTLGHLYGERPSYEPMVEKIGLRRATDDFPKTWKKADRLAELLAFDRGAIVVLEGQGAGRVVEVNMELESFKIAFAEGAELRVGFGGAAKLLRALDPGHILHRKLEAPEALVRLRDEEPTELLRMVLESYDQPRTGAEIRRDLAGIVPEEKWNGWWTAARKHPQVVSPPGGRRAYSWASSDRDAREAIWTTFAAAEPRTAMGLLRQNADRDPDLVARMATVLAATAAEVAGSDPGLACELWFGLERYGHAPADAPWSPVALVAAPDADRLALCAGIRDRGCREQVYATARKVRDDWPELYAQLLWQETDERSLDRLAAALDETGGDHLPAFIDRLLSQPRKSPAAFTWLAERAAERAEWRQRSPLRMLKQILGSLRSDAFTGLRSRLERLCESGSTMPRLVADLTDEQATQAAELLARTTTLADYQRQPLLNALYLRFPQLRPAEEASLYATPEGIARKREELRQLVEVELPANRRAIQEARELGDLSENFEYKSARQRHEYLSARAAAMDRDLKRVRPIPTPEPGTTQVVIGSRVTCQGPGGRARTITILGPWESEPDEDVLSNESDLAQALLGRQLGEKVELGGETFAVAAIEPYQ